MSDVEQIVRDVSEGGDAALWEWAVRLDDAEPARAEPSAGLPTGGNHVLPTGGRARAVGGLGLESFMKPVTVQRLTRTGLARVRPVVEALAAVEGMPAHAEAMRR
jgi:histidinol dehydrogenase